MKMLMLLSLSMLFLSPSWEKYSLNIPDKTNYNGIPNYIPDSFNWSINSLNTIELNDILSDLAISPDGQMLSLLFFNIDGKLLVYDTQTLLSAEGELPEYLISTSIGRGFNSLLFKKKGQNWILAAGGAWSLLYINEIVNDRAGGIGWAKYGGIYTYFRGLENSPEILAMDLSPSGSFFAAGYSSSNFMVYEIRNASDGDTVIPYSSYSAGMDFGPIVALRFISDSQIVVGNDRGQIRLINFQTKRVVGEFKVTGGINSMEVVEKNGIHYLLVSDESGAFTIYDVSHLRLFYRRSVGTNVPDLYISISNDREIALLYTRFGKEIKVYKLDMPFKLPRFLVSTTLKGPISEIKDMAVVKHDENKYFVYAGIGLGGGSIYDKSPEFELRIMEITKHDGEIPILANMENAHNSPLAGKRFHYIVMGVNHNKWNLGYPGLFFAENDAKGISDVLKSHAPGGYSSFDGMTLIGGDFTSDSAQKVIHELLSKADSNDVFFIYFATHGYVDSVRENVYLLCYDTYWVDSISESGAMTVEDTTVKTVISYTWLGDELLNSKAGMIIVIIDACHSGPEDVAFRTTAYTKIKKVVASNPKGRIFLFSTHRNQMAAENFDLKHGIFSYFLIRGLSGEADLNDDSLITISELWQYVRDEVYDYVKKSSGSAFLQSPFILGKVENQPVLFIVK